jgi:hypothetical protein
VQQTPDLLSPVPVGSVSGPSKTHQQLISPERNSCRAIAVFVMPFPLTSPRSCVSLSDF